MPAIAFVIPVRHPDNAKDWSALKVRLSETVRSIAGQTSANWQGVVVADERADLPALPAKFSVVRVPFPPNPIFHIHTADREVAYNAVRIDKGKRILAGMLAATGSRFLMAVDDDDFVSRRIAAHVEDNPEENGWTIEEGYLWSEGSGFVMKRRAFSSLCGTSHIVRADLFRLPVSIEQAPDDYVRSTIGSHIKIEGILAERGTPLRPLPFSGAIYRVGHPGTRSKSRNFWREYVFNRGVMRRPRHFLGALSKCRLLDRHLRREFFGKT